MSISQNRRCLKSPRRSGRISPIRKKEKVEILQKIGKEPATLQRSKGLGENEADMMALTTMNPETRRLIRVTPAGVEETAAMFDLLLGDDLQGRKQFIAEYGHAYLELADIS